MEYNNLKLMRQAISEHNTRMVFSLFKVLSVQDIEKADEQSGLNIIQHAVKENAMKELYMILSQYQNVNINLQCEGIRKRTALEMACEQGNSEIVKILLQHGATMNSNDIKKKFKSNKKVFEMLNMFAKEDDTKKKNFITFFF